MASSSCFPDINSVHVFSSKLIKPRGETKKNKNFVTLRRNPRITKFATREVSKCHLGLKLSENSEIVTRDSRTFLELATGEKLLSRTQLNFQTSISLSSRSSSSVSFPRLYAAAACYKIFSRPLHPF